MPASEQSSCPVRGLRVLLVEDESLIGLLLEDMLAELGYFVVGPVAHLRKAIEMAQCEAIDVAILDININGDESYPIADALVARNIPFVFSSGYGKGGIAARYRDRPTLQKPFRQDDLKNLITKVLPLLKFPDAAPASGAASVADALVGCSKPQISQMSSAGIETRHTTPDGSKSNSAPPSEEY